MAPPALCNPYFMGSVLADSHLLGLIFLVFMWAKDPSLIQRVCLLEICALLMSTH